MDAYQKWVRRNKDYVHSLESLANGLTWLLPERFSDSEIGPEAVTAILGIITAMNEHIIDTAPTQMCAASSKSHSFPYHLFISSIKDMETLVEIVGQHYYGEEKKWNFVAATEAIKVLARFALFRRSGYRMLLHGGETPNMGTTSNPNQNPRKMCSYTGNDGDGWQPWDLERRALNALARFANNAKMSTNPILLQRLRYQHALAQQPSLMADRQRLSSFLSEKGINGTLFVLGEVLFITRPLVYIMLMKKYGRRSWLPWLISLAVDFIGLGFLTHVSKKHTCFSRGERLLHFTVTEKEELKRRKLLWAFYLLRDPFFSKHTRQRLEDAANVVKPVPIVGILTDKVIELIMGAQTRYTYISGS